MLYDFFFCHVMQMKGQSYIWKTLLDLANGPPSSAYCLMQQPDRLEIEQIGQKGQGLQLMLLFSKFPSCSYMHNIKLMHNCNIRQKVWSCIPFQFHHLESLMCSLCCVKNIFLCMSWNYCKFDHPHYLQILFNFISLCCATHCCMLHKVKIPILFSLFSQVLFI